MHVFRGVMSLQIGDQQPLMSAEVERFRCAAESVDRPAITKRRFPRQRRLSATSFLVQHRQRHRSLGIGTLIECIQFGLASITFCTAILAQQPPEAYQVGNLNNLNNTDSFVNVANVGTDNICVNTYVYAKTDPQQMVACCSSVVGPNTPARSRERINY